MSFTQKPLSFNDIAINSVGSLIAGIIGSIVILIITFAIGSIINIPGTFKEASLGVKTSAIFPIALSVITLIGTTLTIFLTYFMLHLTHSERYKRNIIIVGQIGFFAVLTYLFITPIYLYAGLTDYNSIMYVFLIHTLIVTFGTSIILEILNNYRYILIGIYGSFVGLFTSMILTYFIFNSFSDSLAKLIALVVLLPIINFSITFFKQLFEKLYSLYFSYSNQDQLGDIFYQIEMEEKELLREEEEKNSI